MGDAPFGEGPLGPRELAGVGPRGEDRRPPKPLASAAAGPALSGRCTSPLGVSTPFRRNLTGANPVSEGDCVRPRLPGLRLIGPGDAASPPAPAPSRAPPRVAVRARQNLPPCAGSLRGGRAGNALTREFANSRPLSERWRSGRAPGPGPPAAARRSRARPMGAEEVGRLATVTLNETGARRRGVSRAALRAGRGRSRGSRRRPRSSRQRTTEVARAAGDRRRPPACRPSPGRSLPDRCAASLITKPEG